MLKKIHDALVQFRKDQHMARAAFKMAKTRAAWKLLQQDTELLAICQIIAEDRFISIMDKEKSLLAPEITQVKFGYFWGTGGAQNTSSYAKALMTKVTAPTTGAVQ